MDHPLDLQCHPLQYVCGPFEVEGEGELIGEVVVEMVGEVMVDGEGGRGTPEPTLPTSIPPILTHHLIFLYSHRLTHHLQYPQTLTHLYHIRCH